MNTQHIFISIMLGKETHLVGRLWYHCRQGRESASFEYDQTWLKHPKRFALEPALKLLEGNFHTPAGLILFGSMGDSAPDRRWGRLLIRRMERQIAKNNKKASRTLGEIDYLLGVYDELRQGALRFSKNINGPYLSFSDNSSVPPLLQLPKLLSASQRVLDDCETSEDLKLLLIPGSSLGGARPKASVKDQDGRLFMAKFPHRDDEFNVVVWEAVALKLAEQAGIHTSKWQLKKIIDKPVLILERFDREGSQRIPFLSAMGMLEAKEREQGSYLEIAYALIQNGSQPNIDITELWRRLVFNILISNTDDHLRNHGFLYKNDHNIGWRLSPAYDMNPTPIEVRPRILTTAIDFEDSTASLDVALSIIDELRLTKKKAYQIISEVTKPIVKWRCVARSFGLSKREIDRMASAFEHEDLKSTSKKRKTHSIKSKP